MGLTLTPWLKHELNHRLDALMEPDAPVQEFLDRGALRRVRQEHESGRRAHPDLLWRLLVLDLWLRRGHGAVASMPHSA